MQIKWPVAVLYMGLALGALATIYAAKRPLPLVPVKQPVQTESPQTNAPVAMYPSELPYRGTAKDTAAKVPTPARTRVRRTGTRTPKPVATKLPPRRPTGRTGVSCSHIPAVARGLDRDTIVNYAPRYGLNSEQTEQVLRCLHK